MLVPESTQPGWTGLPVGSSPSRVERGARVGRRAALPTLIALIASVWLVHTSNAGGEPNPGARPSPGGSVQMGDAGTQAPGATQASRVTDAGSPGGDTGLAAVERSQRLQPIGGLDGGTGGTDWGSRPDPPPLSSRSQWELDLAFDEGQVALRGAHSVVLDRPTATARSMGRFALELYVGPELVDRVRFDFPLLGAGEYAAKRPWNAPPSFERHLHSNAKVRIPQSQRATMLILVDRAAREAWRVPWPPTPTP